MKSSGLAFQDRVTIQENPVPIERCESSYIIGLVAMHVTMWR